MNLQSFLTSPREITFVRLLKSSTGYFALVLSVISLLKRIIHQNFGKLNLCMQISFIILFMIDVYKDNHVHVFVNFFFEKLLRNYIDWIFTEFRRNIPLIEVKNFSSLLQKNQTCGAIQALRPLYFFFHFPQIFLLFQT